jgi:hypothetical protein
MRIVPWIPPIFRDREAAGRVLGEALGELGLDDPVVVGVARGGVAVAVEVARALGVPVTAVDVERCERARAQARRGYRRRASLPSRGPRRFRGRSCADARAARAAPLPHSMRA